jgi:putative transcriptional regulator
LPSNPSRLAERRRQRRLSQRELAEAVGVHRVTIGRFEAGMETPSLELALKLSRELGRTVNQLFGYVLDDNSQTSKETAVTTTTRNQMTAEKARELFDAYIKTEWVQNHREGGPWHITNKAGARYVPVARNVWILADDVNAWDAAHEAWDRPASEEQPTTFGYEREIEQGFPEALWESALIDPDQPWATYVKPNVRQRIQAHIAARVGNAQGNLARAQAEADQLAREEDDRTIASMNTSRAESGREPLTEEQEQLVRERRQARRKSA